MNFGQSFDLGQPLSLNFDIPRLDAVQIDSPQVQIHSTVSGDLVFGISLDAVSSGPQITADTLLSGLNGGAGLAFNHVGGDGSDLEIRLTDGSERSSSISRASRRSET